MRRRLLAVLLVTAGCSSVEIASVRDDDGGRISKIQRKPSSLPPSQSIVPIKLIWPTSQRHVSRTFKPNAKRPHDGIDISAPKGAKIFSPASGRVVYAGRKFNGYGIMVIIEHAGKLSTIYGHLHKLLVKTGEFVHLGSLIGLVGRTGNATGYHLHFEVRKDYLPINPLDLLP